MPTVEPQLAGPSAVRAGDPPAATFRWPPRPVDPADLAPPRDPAYWKRAGTEPEPARPSLDIDVPPRLARTPLETLADWWLNVETVWLGLSAPPLAVRAAQAGWAPDASAAFCPRCATSVGRHEAGDDGCPECRGKRLAWDRALRLGEYTGLLRDTIHEVKFTAWRRLGRELGRLLGRSLARELDAAGVEADRLVLVPVPTTFWRRVSRGVDHTLAICRGVRDITGGRIVHALGRHHRPSQLSIPVSRRRANVVGTMWPRRGLNLDGRVVVVIDDVRTTGATMTEACRAVAKALPPRAERGDGTAIWSAVLGVTTDGRRNQSRHVPESGNTTDPRTKVMVTVP